ncbi:MAG: hypothetical protein WB799_15170 [Candidatus Sulfotelmatobacter sp.]
MSRISPEFVTRDPVDGPVTVGVLLREGPEEDEEDEEEEDEEEGNEEDDDDDGSDGYSE